MKLELLLILHAVKNKIETRAKQRWYYKYLPARVAEGFTLAEVLITLLVIGIVASLVIPALIHDTQQQEYIIAYKKAFADVNQVFLRARNNYEFIDNGSNDKVVANIHTLRNYFSVTKMCINAVNEGCWVDNCNIGENDCYKAVPNTYPEQGYSEGFIDSSGREWIKYKENGYFIMLVDTNGAKKPNRMGRDRFPLFFDDENGKENAKAPIKVRPSADVPLSKCYYTTWLE